MSNKKSIEDMIDAARTIRSQATANYREFQDSIVRERFRISKAFTGTAQDKMKDVFEKKAKRELFWMFKGQTAAYRDTLTKAKTAAEGIIHTAAPTPPQEQIERFEKQLNEVKTEILLSNPETGAKLLREFISMVEDPFLVTRIKEEYRVLVTPILSESGNMAPRYKNELAGAFEQIKDRTLTPEAREAVLMLDAANAMLDSDLYPQIVVDRVNEHFGHRTAALVNTPDEYFEKNTEDAQLKQGEQTFEEQLLESTLQGFI